MKNTVKFRLYPSVSQEHKLREIFKIYNKVRRVGYKLFLELKDAKLTKNEKRKLVQPRLMELCHNNPYVNAIMIDCEAKVAQQERWFGKRKTYLSHQCKTVLNKIEQAKNIDDKDRRLRGLYSRLSSVRGKLDFLRLKAGKSLEFEETLLFVA
jgi:hypothetical protein